MSKYFIFLLIVAIVTSIATIFVFYTHTTTNNNNNIEQHSSLTKLDSPTSYNVQKNRLLDDNNNLVSLKVYE